MPPRLNLQAAGFEDIIRTVIPAGRRSLTTITADSNRNHWKRVYPRAFCGTVMLRCRIQDDVIRIGARFSVSFQRTLRVPDDGRKYPLPPGLGRFPILRVRDYLARVPKAWRQTGGAFIPMYQREALWLGFDAAPWKPNAIQIAIGGINAVSGESANEDLCANPQNYLVCPNQPWLDGINNGDEAIRQFVAMPLGLGYTVEGQLTGDEEIGGIRLRVFEPKPGRFPDRPPKADAASFPHRMGMVKGGVQMGLAAGGKMKQKIYPDPFGLDAWDLTNYGTVTVHIANSEQYEAITGHAPPTPISALRRTQKTGSLGSSFTTKIKAQLKKSASSQK